MHPSHMIDEEARVVLDLWLAYRRDGMGGVGHLPFDGGYARQPSGLMRAFDAMDAADARINKKLK